MNKIRKWRKTFDLPVRTSFIIPDKEEFKLACALVREELSELEAAYDMFVKDGSKENLFEIWDALGDKCFVDTQLEDIFGFIEVKDQVIDEIYKSNMSKLCESLIEADKSIQYYKQLGIEAYIEPVEVSYKTMYKILRVSDNKVLKSTNWNLPSFKDIKYEL